MKKIVLLLTLLVLAMTFVACKEEKVEETSNQIELDMTLEEIIDEIYSQTGLEFPGMMKTDLTDENMAYVLGVDNFDYLEGVVSEPMMSSQAHSLVLFTVDETADIEAIKKDIKANVNGYKWICVGVEDENILVDHAGQYIILVMDGQSEALMDAFKEVVK